MVRQYRIDRFNGLEILVCEVYHKHLFTQAETEAYLAYNEGSSVHVTQSDFRILVNEELDKEGVDTAFGLHWPIPVYDYTPAVILRGPVVNNRIASLQMEYVDSVSSVEILDEVRRFYDMMRSPHWRDAVSHQIQAYGNLFASEGDS